MQNQLNHQNQDQFDIEIQGYQYPEIIDCGHDSNWLTVKVQATVNCRAWKCYDPCLLTWELHYLITWLNSIKNDDEVDNLIDFTEPNLSFEFLGKTLEDSFKFRVIFELEARPIWASIKDIPWGEFYAEIEKTHEELQSWIDHLKETALYVSAPGRGKT